MRSSRRRGQSMPEDRRSETLMNPSAIRAGDEFLPGNIVEIEVHNFMTYTHLKSRPGARLNLVIGPNGTGKSSLVCAIGLGLAGEPSLLGRASCIGDFVKRGEESGWIRITLQGQGSGNYIKITRRIDKQNKSEWLLEENNVSHPASKKDVQEVVSRFNIQVNNLTQFLPQDRVSEFAKMTPIQLLAETEKAVGDPDLRTHHLSLTMKNDQRKTLEMIITQRQLDLARLKTNIADLEKDVERFQKRKCLLEKAEKLKKKLLLLKYNQKRDLVQTLRETAFNIQQWLHDASMNHITLEQLLNALREKKSEIETATRSLQQSHDQFEFRRQTLIGNESQMGEQVRVKTKEIAEVHKRERVRQQRLATASEDLALAESERANLPDYELPKQEIRDIGNRIREFEFRVAEKRNQKLEREQIRFHKRQQCEDVVRRIAEVDGIKNRLLQALIDSGARGIGDAYKWVQNHGNDFQKDVYGPIILEINIADREHAKYVENHVPSYIWKAFVTQDDKDRDYLQSNLKFFDAVVINARDPSDRNAPRLTPQMEEMGIVARVDEVVSAPPVIKHVLNGQARLDYSFIGTSQANACADQAYELGVNDLWTPENHYRWHRSLYGSQVSASVTAVRASRLLSQSVNASLKTELEDQKEEFEKEVAHIDQEVRNFNNDLHTLEEEVATLHKHREEIFSTVKLERKKSADRTSRIEQRKRRLDSLLIEEDSRTVEKRLRPEISKLNHERKENVLMLKDLVKEFAKNQIQLILEQLALAEMDLKIREQERMCRSVIQLTLEGQRSYNDCKIEASRIQETAKIDGEQVGIITKELQDMFRQMPDTVENLEIAITDALADANAVFCPNPGVIEEYHRRCKQIENLEVEINSGRSKLRACLSEIESIKTRWLPTLRLLVGKINEAFGHNFREMAIAGEVSLDEHAMEFGHYGILIKVKFRETGELQVLNSYHQSGGERSVSIILYLISLQDLVHCPFRVVDEINQGMDPQNERKMFQQLVRAASQPNTPQCFLLTPKLLPDLEYNEACTILNVINGPYIDDAAEAWKDGPSWTTLTRSLGPR